ncbi:NAD(P)/FAD-dependent oxidoreductase [Cellulomonas sp. HZM]|uniref:protoporphyrinogen/coproporphyrinogen oxidase n=1 Tax=Cellulomonas sp. HZM TaxID=1454010 RepID=UPI00054FEFEB|nr:FAD-dependent oxidoreductase [Cellulomonas sp. HZM]
MTQRPDRRDHWDAVVVGGGVAGLAAARDLVTAGHRTLVLEARDAVGGAVRGHEVAGLSLDAGAESFATRGAIVSSYLAELGLADDVRAPAPLGSWVHLPSGDGPLPRTGLLGIPAHPLAADVRRTLGLLGAARAALDAVLPPSVGRDAASLGALVRARMGARVLDRLVRPIVGGVHAADPDDLAVDTVAPGLAAVRTRSLARAVRTLRSSAPAGSAVQGIEGGMHVLVSRLAQEAGEVRTRTAVTAARREDDGFVVVTDAGEVLADRLVVAAPRPDLVAQVTDLGDVTVDEGAVVTLVTLVLDSPALDAAPRGTGVLVARDATDVDAKALTHATAKWPWLAHAAGPSRHVVRLSYGRADTPTTSAPAAPERAGLGRERVSGLARSSGTGALAQGMAADRRAAGDRPDAAGDEIVADDAVAVARRDAAVLLGVDDDELGTLVGHAVVRWTQALPRPSARHRDAVAAVRAAVAEVPGLAVTGAWVAGNGLASVLPDARAAAASVA